jgi:hypothetical protein
MKRPRKTLRKRLEFERELWSAYREIWREFTKRIDAAPDRAALNEARNRATDELYKRAGFTMMPVGCWLPKGFIRGDADVASFFTAPPARASKTRRSP